jgi:hypothetical protein
MITITLKNEEGYGIVQYKADESAYLPNMEQKR